MAPNSNHPDEFMPDNMLGLIETDSRPGSSRSYEQTRPDLYPPSHPPRPYRYTDDLRHASDSRSSWGDSIVGLLQRVFGIILTIPVALVWAPTPGPCSCSSVA